MTGAYAENLSPQDARFTLFQELASRAVAAHEDLADRLLDPAVLLDRDPYINHLAGEILQSLSENERWQFEHLPRTMPLHGLSIQRQEKTEQAIKRLATERVGTLHGFKLALVDSDRAIFSKTIRYKGIEFANIFHIRAQDGRLETSAQLIALHSDPAAIEHPFAESLDTDEALEHIRRYAGFLETVSELPMAEIQKHLSSVRDE